MKNTFKTILRIVLVLSCSQAWGAEAAPQKTGVNAFIATSGATESTELCKVCTAQDTLGTKNVRCPECDSLLHASCMVTKVLEHMLLMAQNYPGDTGIGKVKGGKLTKKQMLTIIDGLPTFHPKNGPLLNLVLQSATTPPFPWPCCNKAASQQKLKELILWAHLYWINPSEYDAQLEEINQPKTLTRETLEQK